MAKKMPKVIIDNQSDPMATIVEVGLGFLSGLSCRLIFRYKLLGMRLDLANIE